MIKKALLAGTLAAGLMLPVQAKAGLILPPKPAIVKPENLEFSKHMLAMPFTLGMLPGKGPTGPTLTYLSSATSSTAGATHTITAAGLGSAAANRYIVISGFAYSGSITVRTLSSLTIGGVSATINVSPTGSVGVTGFICCAAVPSGATGDLVFTFSGSMTVVRYNIYAVYGLASATARSTDNGVVSPGTSITITVGDDVAGVTNDVAVSVIRSFTDVTFTWSGGTPTIVGYDTSTYLSATLKTSSAAVIVTSNGSQAYTVTPSANSNLQMLVALLRGS